MIPDLIAQWISNPLVMQTLRRPGKLSINSGRGYGFALAWIVNVLVIMFAIVIGDSSPIRVLVVVYAVVILSIPPFLAYSAAVITINATQGEPFDLLCVTAISDFSLIQGYLFTHLHRFRGYLALLIVFTPPLLLWADVMAVFDCNYFCSSPASLTLFLTTFLGLSLFALNVLGVFLLSTVIGIFLALWWRSRPLSGLGALMVGLSMSPLFVWALAGTAGMFERNLILLPFPYLLGGLLSWLACRVVRKAS